MKVSWGQEASCSLVRDGSDLILLGGRIVNRSTTDPMTADSRGISIAKKFMNFTDYCIGNTITV
jgi:hypothetical protein